MNTESREAVDPSGPTDANGEVVTEPRESTGPSECTQTNGEEHSQIAVGPISSGPKDSPKRIALYVGLGAVLVYLATWTGPVAFHLHFQGRMAAAREEVPDLAIWTRPEEVPPVRAEGWTLRKEGDVMISVPPGSPEFTREEGTVVATFDAGAIAYRHFQKGLIRDLVRAEAEILGTEIEEDASDVSLLRDLLGETCEDYEFGWPRSRRSLYATRVLAKMRLWEEKSLRKFQFASKDGVLSVLAEYDTGAATVMVAADTGVLVVRIPEGSPASWKISPADWLPR